MICILHLICIVKHLISSITSLQLNLFFIPQRLQRLSLRRLSLRLSRWPDINPFIPLQFEKRFNACNIDNLDTIHDTTHLREKISSFTLQHNSNSRCTIDDTFDNISRASTDAWATDATTDSGDDSIPPPSTASRHCLHLVKFGALTHDEIGEPAHRHLTSTLLHLLLLVNSNYHLHASFFFFLFWLFGTSVVDNTSSKGRVMS